MDAYLFATQIETLQQRVLALRDQAHASHDELPLLMDQLFAEVDTALEELRVADEELAAQYDALLHSQASTDAERRRYRALFEFAPDGYLVTDLYGNIREANLAATQMLGLRHRFLLGKPLLGFVEPTHRLAYSVRLTRLRAGETISEWETRLVPREGAALWVALTASATRDARGQPISLNWQLRDISARREAEAKLWQTTQTLETLFRASPLAIIVVDAGGNITLWNEAATRLMGWQADEVIGRPPPFVSEEAGCAADSHTSVVQGLELACCRKDGTDIMVALSAAPLRDEQDRIVGAVTILADISERKQAERALARMHRRTEVIREEERRHLARELHDGVVQHLIGIAFQVASSRRGVEAAIAASAPVTSDTTLPLDAAQAEIASAIRQLRGLIGDLRPAGLGDLGLHSALEGYISQVRRLGGPALPRIELRVRGDSRRLPVATASTLFRIAQEALRNALRHAEPSLVCLRLTIQDERARLIVNDDGRGFDVPLRLSVLAQQNHFGLVGMQERVAWAGGHLAIRSRPEFGTQIRVRLPLLQEGDEDG